MKKKWLNKFIKEGREVTLTSREKRAMISSILKPDGVLSPYFFFHSFIALRQKQIAAFVVIIAIVLTSGGTSYAAENALPGDTLYSIKVNVNEEIENFVALTPTAKAKVSVKHTSKRLAEAEQLSKSGKLTAETQAVIETSIKKHTDSIKVSIVALASEENATSSVQEVVSDFKNSIEVHEANLATISSSTVSSSTSEHIDALIVKTKEAKNEIDIIEEAVIGTSTPDKMSTSTPATKGTSTVPVIPAESKNKTATSTATSTVPNASSTDQNLPTATSSTEEKLKAKLKA